MLFKFAIQIIIRISHHRRLRAYFRYLRPCQNSHRGLCSSFQPSCTGSAWWYTFPWHTCASQDEWWPQVRRVVLSWRESTPCPLLSIHTRSPSVMARLGWGSCHYSILVTNSGHEEWPDVMRLMWVEAVLISLASLWRATISTPWLWKYLSWEVRTDRWAFLLPSGTRRLVDHLSRAVTMRGFHLHLLHWKHSST